METLPSPDLHPLSFHEGTALLFSQSQILVAHFEPALMESPLWIYVGSFTVTQTCRECFTSVEVTTLQFPPSSGSCILLVHVVCDVSCILEGLVQLFISLRLWFNIGPL